MSNHKNLKSNDTITFEFDSKSNSPNDMTIGLVLSGGGAKGLAHIGVLKVLEREGIHIDYIGGTSMGGLVGGLYAAGYTPEQLDKICNNLEWKKLLSDETERGDLPLQEKKNYDRYMIGLPMIGYKPGLPKGLKEGQLIVNVLNRLTWEVNDIHNFEELPTPFFCVATDIETGDTVLIKNGDLPMALRATMSIPSIFAPVKYNGRTVVDGMIVNNFPVDIMLAQGLDYIIGVDVGSDLYKDDEIKSVLDILDQISSFHQIQRHENNVFLTDMYIKPDVKDISVMSFDDVENVINRGERAAMAHINEIRELVKGMNPKKKRRSFKLNMSDTIFIDKIQIDGLERVSYKMVIGRLGINIPGVNTVSNINDAIDRLYSSNYFDFINYKLIKLEDGYILKIEVEENSNSFFNVGGRYDTDLGASLVLNVELINKIFAGSRLDITFKVGSDPKGRVRYLLDRGQNIGFVFDAHYTSNTIKTYSNDFKSVQGSYFMSFSSLNLLLLSNYSNSSSFVVGGQMEYLNLSTEVSPVPISYSGTPFFNLVARYEMDSFDDKYYPESGGYFLVEPKFITQYNLKSKLLVNLEFATVIKASSKFSILPSGFLGASWNDISETGYFYMLGGGGYTDFQNKKSFIGLPMTASFSENLLYGRVDFRYQIFPKHFLILKTNVATESRLFEELLFNSEFTYGGGLAYGLNSLIGPLEIGVNVSNRSYIPSLFINIGYYF